MNDVISRAARDEEIGLFLRKAGWRQAEIRPLAGDASNRRYLRIHNGRETAVLMDAPPGRGEDVIPFIAVTDWLREQASSAPEIYAADTDLGFLLLEDLGDNLYARHLRAMPSDEAMLYEAAVDLLVELSQIVPPSGLGRDAYPLAAYDKNVLLREARLLIDWWVPAARGGTSSADLGTEYGGLLTAKLAFVEDHRNTVVLRDYHAENLLWLGNRASTARVGLLDYQDALAGHPAYDLVSLLEDARRDTSTDLQAEMIAKYLSRRSDLDADVFRRDYAVLGGQRNLKIIGIFTRLAVRDGKPGYLDLIPRVWAHLMHDLQHPVWRDFAAWVDRYIPAPDHETLDRVRAATER
ncbi:MAG: phosphotransferase [Pseudomonadota bacterium]